METRQAVWPYRASELRHTFAPAQIELQGREILLRGINNGRLLAFVGAGVSMEVGRPSWHAMAEEIYEAALKTTTQHWQTAAADVLRKSLLICYAAQNKNPLVYLQLCDELFKLADTSEGKTTVRERIVGQFGKESPRDPVFLVNAVECPPDKTWAATTALTDAYRAWAEAKNALSDQTTTRLLVRNCGVRRFATTNYDTQVESELTDMGWEKKRDGAHSRERDNEKTLTVNAWHRSASLTPGSLGYAFTFAIEGRRKHASVLHLHGSHEDADAIVATETHYQTHYLRSSPRRDLTDAAISLLFGANPILFVGSGLSEDDVIRPLRQILSSAGQQDDALNVALMPAGGSRAELGNKAIELFARYGIHTIYYDLPGEAQVEPWLYLLKDCCKAIKNKINGLSGSAVTVPTASHLQGPDRHLIRAGLGVLQALVDALAVPRTPGSHNQAAEFEKLVGLMESSITSSCLHLALARIQQDRYAWARDLTEPFEPLQRTLARDAATVEKPYRHVGVVTAGKIDSGSTGRWKLLMDNLRVHKKFLGSAQQIRRVILIPTPRGSGKGSMFDELSDDDGLRAELCTTLSGAVGQQRYRVGLFSMMFLVDITDVIQAIDQLVSLLAPQSTTAETLGGDDDPLRRSVLSRLERSLTLIDPEMQAKPDGRLLLVLSNAGGLFHRDGDAKNGQVLRALTLLMNTRFKSVPIDFIVFCDDQHVPKWFRSGAQEKTKHRRERNRQQGSLTALLPNQTEAQERLRMLGIRPLDLGSTTTHVFVPPRCKAREVALQFPNLCALAHEEPAVPGKTSAPSILKDLYLALGRSRIALTVVLAQAHEIVTAAADEDRASQFEHYIRRAASQLATQIHEDPADATLQFVLDEWESAHRRTAQQTAASGAAGWPMMVELLWNLAVISHPVEFEVLTACPGVRSHGLGLQLDDRGLALAVQRALDLAVDRRLIFKIRPRMGWPLEPEQERKDSVAPESDNARRSRYTVHRTVQRHFVRAMGGRNVDSSEWDQFTTSLYASQRDELPSISPEVHQRVIALIDGLSGLSGGAFVEPSTPEPASAWLEAAKLRAAYFVARSTYSLGVLSHIAQAAATSDDPYASGLMEEYRRRVRWITHRVSRMQAEAAEADKAVQRAARPFLAGEVVWLFAECGAVSLAQGKLEDADALLHLALRAVRRIETDEQGSMHVRILLHLAMTHIERGRPGEARRLLQPIANRTDGHHVPPLLAQCYLGLIDHLGGEYGRAATRYLAARDGLAALGRNRAEALVTKHLADLEFSSSDGDPTHAVALARDAMSIAQRGGHEDVRVLATLTYIRLRSATPDGAGSADAFALLDLAQQYARRMGIPRIECMAHELRARLLLGQGETSMSMQEASASLRIAAMYELRLMKAKAMLTLAEICWRRKEHQLAGQLVLEGGELARATEYFSCVRGFRELDVRISSAGSNGG